MRTVKLELWPYGQEKTDRTNVWKRTRELSKITFKAANHVVNSLYYTDLYQMKEKALYDNTDKIKRKYELKRNKEKIEKQLDELKEQKKSKEELKPLRDEVANIKTELESVNEEIKKIEKIALDKFKNQFQVGPSAFSERRVKEEISDIPSCISNILVNNINGVYQKEKYEVFNGKKTLRTYRNEIPMPIQKARISFYTAVVKDDEGKEHERVFIDWKVQRGEKLTYQIFFGRDKANNRYTIDKLLDGSLRYGAPSLHLKTKENGDTKIFLYLPVDDSEKITTLDSKKSVGVDLGMAVPAVCTSGKSYKYIGSINDFLRIRTGLQNRKRRLQKDLAMVSGGKGRKKKLQALNRIEGKERNFVRQYNHTVSKKVVDFAIQQNAGVIKLEFLKGFGDERNTKKDFVLRNWSYFELQTMIEDKAKRLGITVVKVDPYHTSQICAECGHYEEGQRVNQSQFVCKNPECKNYGKSVNADINAAKNIAVSDKIVTSKDQCQYYIEKKKNKEEK